MSGVFLLFTLCLLTAALVYLLRRWPLPSAVLASLVAAALGWLLWRWPNEGVVLLLGRVIRPAQPVMLLGQRLEMEPASQWVIGFLAIMLALAYLGSWRVSQGWSFFPFGLILLSALSGALLVRPLWMAPATLATGVSLATLVIQAGRQGVTRGALRALWLPVLVTPLFLLAAWHVDQAPLNPDSPFSLQSAARLTSWGLLLLLAPWPLHGLTLSLGEEAPPLVAAWLLTALNVIAVTLLQAFLIRYEWLRDATLLSWPPGLRLPQLLLWGGLAAALWSGLAAAAQRDLSRTWSYAAVYSFGAVLVALGLGARSSWGLVWMLLLARSLGLLVSGFGLAVVRERAGGRTDYASVRGLGTRLPWASTALLLGGLSLAGLPFTAGFVGQWALLQALGSQDWLQAAILLLGALGLCVGLVRSQGVLLGRLENLLLERESWTVVLLAAAGLLAIIAPALQPQVWQTLLSAAIEAFSAAPPGL